jgi:hypothetical protein
MSGRPYLGDSLLLLPEGLPALRGARQGSPDGMEE